MVEEETEQAEEAVEESVEVKEQPKDEPKEEPKEEELDDSGYRKLRRDAAAAKKRAQELEEELARERQAKTQVTQEVETAQSVELPPEIKKMHEDYAYNQAKNEFIGIVNSFKETAPQDFADVTAQYENALFNATRLEHPRASIDEIKAMTERKLLFKASQYASQGYNPAEELYEEARALGFKAIPKKEVEVEAEEEKKPDLNKIAANKARSAGTAAAKGRGTGGQLTALAASELTTQEWAKLPAAEKARILESLR